jgi:hypothetical protein
MTSKPKKNLLKGSPRALNNVATKRMASEQVVLAPAPVVDTGKNGGKSMFEPFIKYWESNPVFLGVSVQKIVKLFIFNGLLAVVAVMENSPAIQEGSMTLSFLVLAENWLKYNLQNVPIVGGLVKKK